MLLHHASHLVVGLHVVLEVLEATIDRFFSVRNTGSWLEIGNSISHFAIASVYIIFLPAIIFSAPPHATPACERPLRRDL